MVGLGTRLKLVVEPLVKNGHCFILRLGPASPSETKFTRAIAPVLSRHVVSIVKAFT